LCLCLPCHKNNRNIIARHLCESHPGACIIKLITAKINSEKYKASVFVKASKK
jgi:hypothetical protein